MKMITDGEMEMDVIAGLCAGFESVFFINLENGMIDTYKISEYLKKDLLQEYVPEVESFGARFREYIETYVIEEDRGQLWSISRLDYLRKLMREETEQRFSYRRDKGDGPEYMRLVITLVKGKQKPERVLVTFRCVQEEVRRQQLQQRVLEEQAEIIQCLSKDYKALLLVDWDTDEVRMYKAMGEGRTILQMIQGARFLSRVMERYIDRVVHPDDRKFVMRQMDSSEIRKILKKQQSHRITYKCTENDETNETELTLTRMVTRRGNDEIVLTIRNINRN